MDPITIALAAGAMAALNGVASQAVKDAYMALKELLGPKLTSLANLEEAPDYEDYCKATSEELRTKGLADDPVVQEKAKALFEALEREAPEYLLAAGISIDQIRAAGEIVVKDLKAQGGVTVKDLEAKIGDVQVEGITAGRPKTDKSDYPGSGSAIAQDSGSSHAVVRFQERPFPQDRELASKAGRKGGRESRQDDREHKDTYRVWYGTDRRPIHEKGVVTGYSNIRDSNIHYGFCNVFIPKSHKIGSIGSSLFKRLITLTDDRLKIIQLAEIPKNTFWLAVESHLRAHDPGTRSAIIFVHGYNVSFEEAALRAAQIGFDLSITGAMAFFSWPSQGTLDGYPADAATIEASEDHIANFMVEFAESSGAKTLHIIAHSMGNRGVLRAVNRIAATVKRRRKKQFGQVILAAADVDADVFRKLSGAYVKLAERTTLYVTTRDRAVEASRWLHDFPRAGLIPPALVIPGIDTINVANVDLSLLGHGYITGARDVLRDMYELLMHGAPPERRFGVKLVTDSVGASYWQIGA